jgi:hypothetical protein
VLGTNQERPLHCGDLCTGDNSCQSRPPGSVSHYARHTFHRGACGSCLRNPNPSISVPYLAVELFPISRAERGRQSWVKFSIRRTRVRSAAIQLSTQPQFPRVGGPPRPLFVLSSGSLLVKRDRVRHLDFDIIQKASTVSFVL